jgi:hypothetical protein
MASLSLIAYAPDLSKPVYQRLLHAICAEQKEGGAAHFAALEE